MFSVGSVKEELSLLYLSVCPESFLEVSRGSRNPSCRGFNRQNVEESQAFFFLPSENLIWNGWQLFRCLNTCSLAVHFFITLIWWRDNEFGDKGQTRTDRQIQKTCLCVCSLSSQGSSAKQSWLKLCKDWLYSSNRECLKHMILNHFQHTAEDAIPCNKSRHAVNVLILLLSYEVMKYARMFIGLGTVWWPGRVWSACGSTNVKQC